MEDTFKSWPSFSVGPNGPEMGSFRDQARRAEGAKNLRSLNRYPNKTTTLYIATYNCRSLSNQSRLVELETETENIKWDVIGLSEVRRKDEELLELASGNTFYYRGTSTGRTGGIGFLINKKWKRRIVEITSISDRVASLTLQLSRRYTVQIIQIYAPTITHTDEEIEELYSNITEALNNNKSHFKYLIGDFNAKVGKRNDKEQVIGKYGVGERNERGERLVQFAHYQNMLIANTFFKKKSNRKWTWVAPNGITKNEIDFILTNKIATIKDVSVINKFQTGSDHRLLRAKIVLDLKLERIKLIAKPTITGINISNLKENLGQYQRTIDERLHDQIDSSQLMQIILDSAKEIGGPQEQNEHRKLSNKTKTMLKQRREMKVTSNVQRIQYTELCKTIRKGIKEDIRKYNERLVENAIENRKNYKKTRKALIIGKKQIVALTNENTRITDRNEIIQLVTKFYSELYKAPETLEEAISNHEDVPEVLPEEVESTISKMKSGKAAGIDGITVELLKYAGKKTWKILAGVFTNCLRSRCIPDHWNTANIILIHKKGNKEDIKNYRPISLLPIIYKIFTKIINNRLTNALDAAQPREQAGFRSGFSTMDHIHTLRELMSRAKEYEIPLALTFIDFEKAFDSIYPKAVIEALTNQGIDKPYIETLANIYRQAKAKVKIYENTPEFPTTRGVRQGDSISPKLFTATLENIFSKMNWQNKGLCIDGEYLNHLRFADDIVLIAKNPAELQELISDLNAASNEVGLKMNLTKTKTMYNELVDVQDVIINNTALETVDEYIYLGQLIHKSGSLLPEINRRMKLAWAAFGKNSVIFKSRMPLHLKKKAFDQCILPVMTYGCETWTLKKDIIAKLKVTQRSMERCMLGITKRDRKRIEWIRQKTKVTDVIHRIKSLKWQWAGHLARRTDNRWSTRITLWYPRGVKRPRRRPNLRWDYDIRKQAGTTWHRKANIRQSWADMKNDYVREAAP